VAFISSNCEMRNLTKFKPMPDKGLKPFRILNGIR
jgi:hypothetical protein